MAKINLLPWREERRNQLNQQFGIVVGVTFAVAAIIIYAIGSYYDAKIDAQEERNQFMEKKIAELDNKIKAIKSLKSKKENLLRRIETIQQLQTNRTEIVHLFDEMVRKLPAGVYLTAMEQKGSKLVLNGVADSNTRVSEFVKQIEASEWMKDPKIDIIQRNSKSAVRTNTFTLRAQQSRPKSANPDNKEGDS